MKQLRWVIILAVSAVLLTVVFLFVNKNAEKKEKQAKAGESKQLFSIDVDDVTRIVVDNEDGHFAFDWSNSAGTWELVSADRFNLNPYAVQAICTAFCTLWSEKTIAFDCKDTSPYGFDEPVKVQVYTKQTGTENPYILYVGDNTPTYDSYYAMVDGSDDVYTIDYSSGSMFCVAKNTLKNLFLFDTTSGNVDYYRAEDADGNVIELKRDSSTLWQLLKPDVQQDLDRSSVDAIVSALIRVTVTAYMQDDPDNLAMYGLDKPQLKLLIQGRASDADHTPMNEEIWFGKNISDKPDETEMYGYFVNSNQVFKLLRADVAAIHQDLIDYLVPYCASVNVSEVKSIDIDLGDVLNVKTKLDIDYENDTYMLDGKQVTGEENLSLCQNFYRSVTQLRFSEIGLDAKPEGEPAMRITYDFHDGTSTELGFVQFADNNFYLMRNDEYTGLTVRLNRFTSVNSLTKNYETLAEAMKKAS